MAYSWPDNVRELKNMAARYTLSDSRALPDLEGYAPGAASAEHAAKHDAERPTLPSHVRAFEGQLITEDHQKAQMRHACRHGRPGSAPPHSQ